MAAPEPTTQQLTERLGHHDENVRLRAAMDLGLSTDPAAARVLVDRLGTESEPAVREMITWATVQHADHARTELYVQLYSAEPEVRAQAAHVLSKIGGESILSAILPVIDDDDPVVAVKVYRAAASTRSEAACAALFGRLGVGDALVRDALTDALASFDPAWTVRPLIAGLADADPILQIHCADTLADIGSPGADEAIDRLAEHLSDPGLPVRVAMLCALSRLDPARTEPIIRTVADGDDPELAEVARRLADLPR